MDMGLLFWIIMILCILTYIGGWAGWQGPWVYGSSVITLVLFGLLGWKVFGPILK
jgi:hypothetical protein